MKPSKPNSAGVLELWSLRPWQRRRALSGRASKWESGNGIAFSGDGRLVAFGFGDSTVEVYRTDNGELWARLGRKQFAPAGESDGYYRVGALAFAPDGKSLASSNIKGVFSWDLRARRLQFSRPITARVQDLVRDANGRLGSSVRATNARDLCFSPDGQTLAIAGESGFPGFLFDVARRRVRHVLPLGAQEGAANRIIFSPDGKRVLCVGVWAASGGSYDKLDCFNAQSGRAQWRWSDAEDYSKGAFVANAYDQVAFSSDGRRFAIGNGQITEIRSAKNGGLLSRRGSYDNRALVGQKQMLPELAVR